MRRLGQHFLINKAAIKKIIAALELERGDDVIEIGPGKGALTLPLAEECQKIGCKIIAIEKDQRLAFSFELLAFRNNLAVQILKGDALKELPKLIKTQNPCLAGRQAKPKTYKLVGNIPYYITGKLLRIIGELEPKPKLVILTLQKEVAERVIARKGNMNPAHKQVMCGMNLLAAAVQIWAEPKIIGYLKPSDFSPPPKVKSAIIKLVTGKQQLVNRELGNYYELIKVLFKQPRKTLLNNLRMGLKISSGEAEKLLKSIGLDEKSRPQDLSIEMLISLLGLVSENIL